MVALAITKKFSPLKNKFNALNETQILAFKDNL